MNGLYLLDNMVTFNIGHLDYIKWNPGLAQIGLHQATEANYMEITDTLSKFADWDIDPNLRKSLLFQIALNFAASNSCSLPQEPRDILHAY